jgi:hypothetical protein
MTTKPAPCCPSCAANASELAALRDRMDAWERNLTRAEKGIGEAVSASARPTGVGRTVLTVLPGGAA